MPFEEQAAPRQRFLTTQQAADYLGLKLNTLAKMRVYGRGPKYRKHGFRVLYALDDLNAWSEASMRVATTDNPPSPDGYDDDE